MVKLWGLQWRGIFHHGDQGAHLPSPLSRLLRRKPRRAVLINWTLALEAFNHLLCIRAFHTEFDAGRQGKENSFSTFKGDQINQISNISSLGDKLSRPPQKKTCGWSFLTTCDDFGRKSDDFCKINGPVRSCQEIWLCYSSFGVS